MAFMFLLILLSFYSKEKQISVLFTSFLGDTRDVPCRGRRCCSWPRRTDGPPGSSTSCAPRTGRSCSPRRCSCPARSACCWWPPRTEERRETETLSHCSDGVTRFGSQTREGGQLLNINNEQKLRPRETSFPINDVLIPLDCRGREERKASSVLNTKWSSR